MTELTLTFYSFSIACALESSLFFLRFEIYSMALPLAYVAPEFFGIGLGYGTRAFLGGDFSSLTPVREGKRLLDLEPIGAVVFPGEETVIEDGFPPPNDSRILGLLGVLMSIDC